MSRPKTKRAKSKQTATQAAADRQQLRRRLLKMIVQNESVRKCKPR